MKQTMMNIAPTLENNTESEILCCDSCEFKTLKKSLLKSHIASHLPFAERKKFECKKCHKIFTRATSLRVHLLTVHDKTRKYKCPQCVISFKELTHLSEHIAVKHGKPFNCDICDRTFFKRSLFESHGRQFHAKKLSMESIEPVKAKLLFVCHCGKTLSTKTRLLKHQLSHKHKREVDTAKKFKCPEPSCHRSFKQRCNLVRHQKEKEHLLPQQMNNLKYRCSCGSKFFTERGYSFHCETSDCVKQEI